MTTVVAVAQLIQELVGRGALLDLPMSLLLSRGTVLHQLLVSVPEFLAKKFGTATGTAAEVAQAHAALEAYHEHMAQAFRVLPMPTEAWDAWAEQLHVAPYLSRNMKAIPKLTKVIQKFVNIYANVHRLAPALVCTRRRMEERLDRLVSHFKELVGDAVGSDSTDTSAVLTCLKAYRAFRREICDIRRWTDHRFGLADRPFSVEREFLESFVLPLVDDETYEALVRRTFVEQMSLPHANVQATVALFRETEVDEDVRARVGSRLERAVSAFQQDKTFQWLGKWHEEFGELLVGAESIGPLRFTQGFAADHRIAYVDAEEKMQRIVAALLGVRKAKAAFLLAYDFFCAVPISLTSPQDEIARGRELLRILSKVPSLSDAELYTGDAEQAAGDDDWSSIARSPSPPILSGITDKERLVLHIHIGTRMLSALEAPFVSFRDGDGRGAAGSPAVESSAVLETARLLVDVLRLVRLSLDAQCADGVRACRLQSPDFVLLSSSVVNAVRKLSTLLLALAPTPPSVDAAVATAPVVDAETMNDFLATVLVEHACNTTDADERAALVDEAAKLLAPPLGCNASRVALLLRCSSLLEGRHWELPSLRAAMSAWDGDAAVSALDFMRQPASALMLLPSLKQLQRGGGSTGEAVIDHSKGTARRTTDREEVAPEAALDRNLGKRPRDSV